MDLTTGEYYSFIIRALTKSRLYLGITNRPGALSHKLFIFGFIALKLASILKYFLGRLDDRGVISTFVWYLCGNVAQHIKYILLIFDQRRHEYMLDWLGAVVSQKFDGDLQDVVDKEMGKSLKTSYIFLK